MFNPDPPEDRKNPLGLPVRREDWYIIDDKGLTTCAVVVYPNELVGVPKETYIQLQGGEVRATPSRPEGVYLVDYEDVVALLEKNGFVRL